MSNHEKKGNEESAFDYLSLVARINKMKTASKVYEEGTTITTGELRKSHVSISTSSFVSERLIVHGLLTCCIFGICNSGTRLLVFVMEHNRSNVLGRFNGLWNAFASYIARHNISPPFDASHFSSRLVQFKCLAFVLWYARTME